MLRGTAHPSTYQADMLPVPYQVPWSQLEVTARLIYRVASCIIGWATECTEDIPIVKSECTTCTLNFTPYNPLHILRPQSWTMSWSRTMRETVMTTARCPEPQSVKVILKSHGITRPDLGDAKVRPSPYSSQAPQEATPPSLSSNRTARCWARTRPPRMPRYRMCTWLRCTLSEEWWVESWQGIVQDPRWSQYDNAIS